MDCVPDLTASLPVIPRPRYHVEICLSQNSIARSNVVVQHSSSFLHQAGDVYEGTYFSEFPKDDFLQGNVRSILVCNRDCDSNSLNQRVDFVNGTLDYHVFQLNEEGPATEDMEQEDNIPAANHWILPAAEFHGTWDSLIYDSNVKEQLLNYAHTTLLFSDRNVDPNLVAWNRVILLHGPPGTGKTSLCKALAQKLTIRLSDRFRYGQLLEINSHSLFSKWFSESGKLVLKMFQRIQELVEDKDSLVFILIDEVESLTAARSSAINGTEPSDSIRVVNALLTQLDQIKRNSNVIILTTSNVTGAIDLAFVDRADIKQYIGNPSTNAIYKIYQSCLKELIEKGIISPPETVLDLRSLEVIRYHENEATRLSLRLLKLARKSQGCSGRNLRKLPFLAHALFLQAPTSTLEQFLDALSYAVDKHMADRERLDESQNSRTEKEHVTCNGEM